VKGERKRAGERDRAIKTQKDRKIGKRERERERVIGNLSALLCYLVYLARERERGRERERR
jgi:hypothetical protein